MQVSEAWSHDVVLRAMCDEIAGQRSEGTWADFILATGDLAFSGKADEYRLAGEFFDALSTASGVPKGRIFCVPGNHDVDRDRQTMCFRGARHVLQSTSHVDSFLTPGEDLEALLKRQENYRSFLESYFRGQDRTWTPEGLGYVSCVVIDDVRLAIVGLNSAWLAEGGFSDHGKLLLGERQTIDALTLATKLDPHVVIANGPSPLSSAPGIRPWARPESHRGCLPLLSLRPPPRTGDAACRPRRTGLPDHRRRRFVRDAPVPQQLLDRDPRPAEGETNDKSNPV